MRLFVVVEENEFLPYFGRPAPAFKHYRVCLKVKVGRVVKLLPILLMGSDDDVCKKGKGRGSPSFLWRRQFRVWYLQHWRTLWVATFLAGCLFCLPSLAPRLAANLFKQKARHVDLKVFVYDLPPEFNLAPLRKLISDKKRFPHYLHQGAEVYFHQRLLNHR